MAVGIVDLLEVIGIEDRNREGTAIALGPEELVLESLVELTSVGDTGQAIGDHHAVDFFVVDRFDITAADIFKDERANLELVTALEQTRLDTVVVDAATVGAVEVFEDKASGGSFDLRVVPGDALIDQDDIVAEVAANRRDITVEAVALAQLRSVNLDKYTVIVGTADSRSGRPGFHPHSSTTPTSGYSSSSSKRISKPSISPASSRRTFECRVGLTETSAEHLY